MDKSKTQRKFLKTYSSLVTAIIIITIESDTKQRCQTECALSFNFYFALHYIKFSKLRINFILFHFQARILQLQ